MNINKEPVRLWALNYLPGYHSIYFTVCEVDTNKDFWIKRNLIRWTINVPAFDEIQPNEFKEIRIDINDGSWDLSQISNVNLDKEVSVIVMIEIVKDELTDEYGILTGKFESNKLNFNSKSEIVEFFGSDEKSN